MMGLGPVELVLLAAGVLCTLCGIAGVVVGIVYYVWTTRKSPTEPQVSETSALDDTIAHDPGP